MTVIMFLLIIIIQITQAAQRVSWNEYNSQSICGDKIYDPYSEECDGVTGCGPDCRCLVGYTPDNLGNCTMDCVFGDKCINGCTKPNVCEICDTTKGYTQDCKNCQEDYMWYGVNNCSKIQKRNILSCKSFFDRVNLTRNGQFNYFFVINEFGNKTFEKTIRYDAIKNVNFITIAYCSPFVRLGTSYTYGYWFKLQLTVGKKYVIELDRQWTEGNYFSHS